VASAGLSQPRFDGAGSGQYTGARYLLNRMTDGINGGPYPLQVLLVAGANPCHELPDKQRKGGLRANPVYRQFFVVQGRNRRHGRPPAA
jgi:anaerobic selenocysteine-containing dehydrogenase